MLLLARQSQQLPTTRGQVLASIEEQRDLCAQFCPGGRVSARSPHLVHEGTRKAPSLRPQGSGTGTLLSARLQHTGREPREYRHTSGGHASGFAFPERGRALPGAEPWLLVPAAQSMTGHALPWRRSARPAPPRPVHLPGGTPLRGAPRAGGQEARASALPPPVSRSWRGEEMAPERTRSCLIVWPDRASVDLGSGPSSPTGAGVLTRVLNTTPLPPLPKTAPYTLFGPVPITWWPAPVMGQFGFQIRGLRYHLCLPTPSACLSVHGKPPPPPQGCFPHSNPRRVPPGSGKSVLPGGHDSLPITPLLPRSYSSKVGRKPSTG